MTTYNNGGRLLLHSVCIDNYKCFSGFKLPFGDLTLLLGANGCGKTTVFDAIIALTRLVCHGARVRDLFPESTLPRWGYDINEQTFELRASGENGGSDFCYRLTVGHQPAIKQIGVKSETLTMNGDLLYEFADGEGSLYPNRDNRQTGGARVRFPFGRDVSGMPYIGVYCGSRPLQNFLNWLGSITLLSLAPDRMQKGSDEKEQHPNADGSNFASWYRWARRIDPSAMTTADEALCRVLPGYQRVQLVPVGDEKHRELRAFFSSESGAEQSYAFTELSAGQRVLIALYYFLHGGGRNRLLLLDEPDNFVTLPEVQPLLLDIAEEAGDELPQVAMISHHPEAIDSISPENAVWMDREAEQPARIVDFENDTPLSTSELFSQGMAP